MTHLEGRRGRSLFGTALLIAMLAITLSLAIPGSQLSASSTTTSVVTAERSDWADFGPGVAGDACTDCGAIQANGEYMYPVMEDPPQMPDPAGADPKFEVRAASVGSAPTSFSWLSYAGGDWTTPARNQGSCGSCWDFAALGALEAAVNIGEGNPNLDPNLSEQYVLSCLPYAGSCSGGSSYRAFQYIQAETAGGNYANGVIPETCLPYQATSSVPCSSKCADWQSRLTPISGYGYWYLDPPSERDFLKSKLIEKGPLVTYMAATSSFMTWGNTHHDPNDYYPSPTTDGSVNHAVVIVGYKDDPSIGNGGYWIVKNSWGTRFGYNGFYNVEYDSLHHGEYILYVSYQAAGDNTPPSTSGHDPAPGETNVPVDTSISLHIQDYGEGVNVNTIAMTVEGARVTPVITGTKTDYTVTYYPPTSFAYSQVVDVRINAADLAGNVMPTVAYSFTTGSSTAVQAEFTGGPRSGDEPLTVAFQDLSTPSYGISSWRWDFNGDGVVDSTTKNPTHTYAQDGVYSVSLTVTWSDGTRQTETKAGYIAVSDSEPTANFSAEAAGADQPLTIRFTDLSTTYDGITSWSWSFGDGSTSTLQHPLHTYGAGGLYTVTLRVTEADGSTNSVTRQVSASSVESGIKVTVTVGGEPLAGWCVYPYSIDGVRYLYQYTDASGEAVFSLPAGTYEFRVSYDYKYWWSEKASVPGSASIEIPPPTVVTVLASGSPVPDCQVYAYTADGYYAARSRPTDASGQAYFTLTDGSYKFRVYYDAAYWWSQIVTAPGSAVINVSGDPTPIEADFSATPRTGNAPLAVAFTDLSTPAGDIVSWRWDFNNDGVTDSMQQNPTYVYGKDGVYTVSLTVTATDGTTSRETKVGYISVTSDELAADFSASPRSGAEPLGVVFTDLSTPAGSIVSWRWDFNNDGVVDSTQQNPSYTYERDGVYTVSLSVTAADGASRTAVKTGYVIVSDTLPQVDFSASLAGDDQPLTVLFADLSTSYDGVVSWSWNFGDGGSSNLRNPQHTYSEAGRYTVTLSVTDADGSVASAARQVEVGSPDPVLKVWVTVGGEPLAGSRVYPYSIDGVRYLYQKTDASGLAVFTLPNGSYKFRVYYEGNYWWSEATSFPGTATIDIPAPTIVTVTVGGAPLQNGYVYAFEAEGTYPFTSRTTDALGQVSLTLAPGDYKFRVYYDGSYWWSEVVTAPASASINIPSASVASPVPDSSESCCAGLVSTVVLDGGLPPASLTIETGCLVGVRDDSD